VRIEQTPVLILADDHEEDTLLLRNVGRGVAFAVFMADEDGTLLQSSTPLAPGKSRAIHTSGIEFSITSGTSSMQRTSRVDGCELSRPDTNSSQDVSNVSTFQART
jgi:hypothetical protein